MKAYIYFVGITEKTELWRVMGDCNNNRGAGTRMVRGAGEEDSL